MPIAVILRTISAALNWRITGIGMTRLQLADCICMAGCLAFMIALGSSFARQQMATNG